MQIVLTPDILIEAYKQGLFPMAYDGHSDYIHWVCPELRGQLPIQDFHVSKSLKKDIQKNIRNRSYSIKIDTDFEAVIRGCAEIRTQRPETWINPPIIEAFCQLHAKGHAHSVEYWEGNALLGGVYGLKIGGAFFGESMFSRATNASKIALTHLAARLWKGGFSVFDTQFINDHLHQFGVYEIPHEDYLKTLEDAITQDTDFNLGNISEAALIHDFFNMQDSTTAIEQKQSQFDE